MKRRALQAITLAALFTATAVAFQDSGVLRVEVAATQRVDIERRLPVVGRLRPYQRAVLVPRVTGYLSSITIEPGALVSKGDLLASLAVPDIEAQVRAAEAMLAEAVARGEDAEARVEKARAAVGVADAQGKLRRAELEVCRAEYRIEELSHARVKELVEGRAETAERLEEAEGERAMAKARGDAAQAQVEVAESMSAAARAELTAAEAGARSAEAKAATFEATLDHERVRLSFAELRNPYENGLVTRRWVDPGALVEEGETQVLEVMDISRLRATFDVPEREASLLRNGLPVEIVIDALGGAPIEAALTRSYGAIDPMTGTMRAEVELENDGRLMPGMFCQIELLAISRPNAIVVPADAIYADGESVWVMVDANGVAKRVAVELGVDDGRQSEVLTGLKGTERVILGRPPGLRDGDRVEGVVRGAGR